MIRLEGIYKSYGAIKVLEGLNLEIHEGEPLCLLGRSGCGKSTLLKMIALITKPDIGSLEIDGEKISGMADAQVDEVRKERVSYIFQEPLLIPYITVVENLIEVTGAPKAKAVDVLCQLGLSERLEHYPTKLSGGEKKRVDVARAILRGTKILVADEPLANLDSESGAMVTTLLKAHSERGGILVYSSVNSAETKHATRILHMEK